MRLWIRHYLDSSLWGRSLAFFSNTKSLALLSGLRIWHCVSCGIGRRHSSDLELLWFWYRPVATALIPPLAWESPYATGAALKKTKEKRKKECGCSVAHLLLPRWFEIKIISPLGWINTKENCSRHLRYSANFLTQNKYNSIMNPVYASPINQ